MTDGRSADLPNRLSPRRHPSVAVGLLGVHAGRVTLQLDRAPTQRLERRYPARGREHIALRHLREPVHQLHMIDLVLLQLRETEMTRHELLLDTGEEVLALIHDLLILVVTGGPERRDDLALAGQYGTGQQHRGPVHGQYL